MDILILALSSALFRIGGSDKLKDWPKGVEKKGARIIALPALLAVFCAFKFANPLYLAMALTGQAMRLGDGIPDNTDKGSFLGRIFKKDYLTTGVVMLLSSSALYMPKFLITHNLEKYLIYIAINILTGAVFKLLKAKDIIIEPARGLSLASIILI